MWQTKDVRAASVNQGKRYAERWCASQLYPELRLGVYRQTMLQRWPVWSVFSWAWPCGGTSAGARISGSWPNSGNE